MYVLLVFAYLYLNFHACVSTCVPPSCARIGFVYPKFTRDSQNNFIVSHEGIQYLAALKMALDDMKSGMYKDVFPNITYELSARGVSIPFIDDVKNTLYFNTAAFGGEAIHAFIGSADNAASNAAAQIGNT